MKWSPTNIQNDGSFIMFKCQICILPIIVVDQRLLFTMPFWSAQLLQITDKSSKCMKQCFLLSNNKYYNQKLILGSKDDFFFPP